jgi:Haem degrading protein HbpS-like
MTKRGIIVAILATVFCLPAEAQSADLAIQKVRKAARLQRPTAEIDDNINQGRTAFITADIMALRGSVPVRVGGEVVGAVGIRHRNRQGRGSSREPAFAAQAAVSIALSNLQSSAGHWSGIAGHNVVYAHGQTSLQREKVHETRYRRHGKCRMRHCARSSDAR